MNIHKFCLDFILCGLFWMHIGIAIQIVICYGARMWREGRFRSLVRKGDRLIESVLYYICILENQILAFQIYLSINLCNLVKTF